MVKTIDFAKLSLMDALDLAILIEEEAEDRYREFVDQMALHHTPEAAAFFRTMAGNEHKHGEELLIRRRELFPTEVSRMDRSMLWDVEAPGFDQARAFMSARQAMEVALQGEITAHDYFDRVLEYVVDPEVRRLFEELREEEVVHQTLVRKELAKLPPAPDFNPEDYVDEPTAQ
jgi:erythrin-vacuolar iron transport family protein